VLVLACSDLCLHCAPRDLCHNSRTRPADHSLPFVNRGLLLKMCGSLDDCHSFTDLLSDSDDDFNLSAGVLGSLSNSPLTRSTSQNASEFQLGPATYDEINDYMLNTDDADTGCFSQIEFEWECGSAVSESRSRATDAPATVALEQDAMCVSGHDKAVSSAQCVGNFSIAYTH
jgi:hypothetical protein